MINVFHDPDASPNTWSVWHDVDGMEKDGLCIGVGKTKIAALKDARLELSQVQTQLAGMICDELNGKVRVTGQ